MSVDLSVRARFGQLALRLAVEGGRLARDLRTRGFEIDAKSTPTDLVTDVDRAVEAWIVAQLRRERPADAILGEEGTVTGSALEPGTAFVRWLIDPIDGTVNFALDIGHWAVSVAVEVDGQVVAGCVSNPSSREVFHAVLGGGAFRTIDDPLRLSAPGTALGGPRDIGLAGSVIGTGFAYDAARRSRQGQVVAALLAQIADVRRFGAASLDLCAVATGRLDAYFEAGLNSWDYAAGLLIAAEAGCVASGLRGRAPSEQFCAVAGRNLGPALFDLLADLGADRVL